MLRGFNGSALVRGLLTTVILISYWTVLGQEGSFQIVGTVQSETGSLPKSDIWVSAMLTPRTSANPAVFGTVIRPDFKPVNVHAQVDGDGKFQMQGLPAGEYLVCGQVVSKELINGCTWQIAQRVMVPEMSTGIVVVLQKGHRVKVILKDPKELRGKVKRKLDDMPAVEADIDLSLTADGGIFAQLEPVFDDAQESQREPNTARYEALVPFERPVRMLLNSKVFSIRDEATKQPLSKNGKSETITAPRGNAESVFQITLDGIQPGKEADSGF